MSEILHREVIYGRRELTGLGRRHRGKRRGDRGAVIATAPKDAGYGSLSPQGRIAIITPLRRGGDRRRQQFTHRGDIERRYGC